MANWSNWSFPGRPFFLSYFALIQLGSLFVEKIAPTSHPTRDREYLFSKRGDKFIFDEFLNY